MQIEYSNHWKRKNRYRPDISEDIILFAIRHSKIIRDKHWTNALNAVCRIPPMSRKIKVVYRRKGKTLKIITAFWLE